MTILTPSAILLAGAASAPSLWSALVTHSLPLDTALTRFVILVPATGALLAGFRAVVGPYVRSQARSRMRRANDVLAAPEPPVLPTMPMTPEPVRPPAA
ncbi:MAG: hypothetical protein DLM59_19590 [Pseudonocardiales bacterium]|nr:MAG: hypothetical protein DLM59_19590 [Pseudonocardiales bacterium]